MLFFAVHNILQPRLQNSRIMPRRTGNQWDMQVLTTEMDL